MSDDISQTVKDMAKLVVASNRISEVHEMNLKTYPFIFFEQITEAKIDYDLYVRHDVDLDGKNNLTIKKPLTNCHVSYYLTLNEDANKTNLQRRFETLENSVRALFWKDLSVEIYFNDNIVYKSKK